MNVDQQEEELDTMQVEARLIGRRILALQAEMKVWDREGKKYRAPEFRDMVILLRSVKTTAPVFLEEFRKMGIPVYAETGSGYFAAPEVQVMLSLLRVIDNPCQDIPLTAVLLSPVVGLSLKNWPSCYAVPAIIIMRYDWPPVWKGAFKKS